MLRILKPMTTVLLSIAMLLINDSIHAQVRWSTRYSGIGTFSSPRVADLNGDGVGDVVLGAGREEFQACDSAVFALDGATGKMLWHVGAKDQIFGSAALKDITGDAVVDVIIGGRSAELIAINGRTGQVIWRFDKKAGKDKWYGFYNPQFVTDIDHDGLEDILTSNGGNVWAAPHDERKRPPGTLVVISSKTGALLAKTKMPDKRETYMSVSALRHADGDDYDVMFGTGGETVGGSLYVSTLSAVLNGDLSGAKLLDSTPKNGYVAPGVWIDIDGDNRHDIVSNAVEGKITAFDGKTFLPRWSVKVPNTEAYSSIAPGYFTDDRIPDFFISYAVGVWPKLEWSKQLMVNGADGTVMYTDSLGFYQTSSPVVADLDGDGRDEVLLSVNVHVYDELNRRELQNMLVSINFKDGRVESMSETNKGSNISTTPWIGDMDGDGLLDIVYCHATNTKKSYTFDGVQINRIATTIPVRPGLKWGSYMGSNYDGVFNKGTDLRTAGH
jgi:outer membrane protein assembly factor BamB